MRYTHIHRRAVENASSRTGSVEGGSAHHAPAKLTAVQGLRSRQMPKRQAGALVTYGQAVVRLCCKRRQQQRPYRRAATAEEPTAVTSLIQRTELMNK